MAATNYLRALAVITAMAVAALVAASLLAAQPAHAADFTVTNTNDSGAGSLRQAMLDANDTTGADTIKFSIPGGFRAKTISPNSALPPITDQVAINGYSQPGSSENTQLDSSLVLQL